MLKLLEEVAARRQQKNNQNTTIQLSYTLMDKAHKALRGYSMEMTTKISTDFSEVTVNFHGINYTLRNRSYRDDTNDIDVEEILCEFAGIE